jgi:A/G-specific adenine glycosylase
VKHLIQGTVNDLPVKTTKVSKKIIKQHVYIIKNNENEYLIEQRTAKLLNNMWEFPMYEATQKDNINTELATNMTFSDKPIYKLKHQFTHLQWDIEVYMADEVIDKQQVELPERMQWMHFDDKEQYNFPVSMTKVYKFLKEH